jgi:hypothetical protein
MPESIEIEYPYSDAFDDNISATESQELGNSHILEMKVEEVMLDSLHIP